MSRFREQIFVRPAQPEEVRVVRWFGYWKYFERPDDVLDALDYASNTTLLLATDASGRPLGTLRLIDRRGGPVEIDRYLDVDPYLPDESRSVVEATRFAVPRHPWSPQVKQMLWKAYYLYCRRSRADRMLIWACRSAARDYQRLLFEPLGRRAVFYHPGLGGKKHEVFHLKVAEAVARYAAANHALYEFFCRTDHPNITITRPNVDPPAESHYLG